MMHEKVCDTSDDKMVSCEISCSQPTVQFLWFPQKGMKEMIDDAASLMVKKELCIS